MTLSAQSVFATACVICGCYNEICIKSGENYFSTYLWKAENACYNKFGICEPNKCGDCSWKQTKELVECVNLQLERVEKGSLGTD